MNGNSMPNVCHQDASDKKNNNRCLKNYPFPSLILSNFMNAISQLYRYTRSLAFESRCHYLK